MFDVVNPSAMDAAMDGSLFHSLQEHIPTLHGVNYWEDGAARHAAVVTVEIMSPMYPGERTWKIETPEHALRSQSKYEYVARICLLIRNPTFHSAHLGGVTSYRYENIR
jgi:hypothetical protein